MAAKLARLPSKTAPVTLGSAMEAFLDEADLAPTTRRVYGSSLAALASGVGARTVLSELEPATVAAWFTDRYRSTAPATWNRELATLRSAMAWWSKRAWLGADATASLERRREHPDRTRALTRRQVESLWRRPDVALREKTLWRLLYESAARANEILGLDIAELDLPSKRARVRSKGGATEWVFWQTGTAQLLPRLLAGRTAGPVFLAGRLPTRPAPARDVDPGSGPGSPVLPARRHPVPRSHRLELAPAAALGANPCRRGRDQPSPAPRPLPSRIGPLPGALRPARARGRRPCRCRS